MSTSSKVFSGVIWSIVTNVVNALYGFLMIPILISYFGKAEYGLIGLAQSINAYMQLMDMGLTSTNVRFFSNWLAKKDETRVQKLFSTCSVFYGIIGLINALVLVIVYFFSADIFNVSPEQDAILKNLLLILAVSAFVNWATSCYSQIIQATENVAWTQKRLLVTKLLMIGALGITILCDLTITQYYFLTVLCNWVILPRVVTKIREVAPMVNFIPKFDKDVFKEILPYTLNIFSFTIFSYSFMNLRPIFLGIQGTPSDVTDFKVIMGIYGIIMTVSNIFLSTLLPTSSKAIANNDRNAFDRIAYDSTKYIMLFISFCVFGMLSIAKDLVIVYVGEEYLYLMPWLICLLLTLLTNHIMGISSLILGGSNIKPLSYMTAVSAVTGLIVAWFTIPQYGVGGTVIASVAYSVMQIIFYYVYYWPIVMKINSWFILYRIVLPTILYSSLAYLAVFLIPSNGNPWVNILIKGMSYTLLFGLCTYFFLNERDKSFIMKLLKR